MSYSVVVTYQTPSGNKTVGTNSSKQNSTISNLQSQGYKIIKIEAQGAGKNVVAPVKAAVPSAQQNKETTTIYEAGTPIGKELEAPVAPIKTEPLPMNTLTSTRTSSGEQYVRTEYTQTPEGILKTTTTTFNPSKLDSSVKAIPETQQSIQNRQDAALAKTGWMGQTVVAGKRALGPVMNAPDYLYSAIAPYTDFLVHRKISSIGNMATAIEKEHENVQAKGKVLWSNLINKNYTGATTDVLLGSSTMTDIVEPLALGFGLKYVVAFGSTLGTTGSKLFTAWSTGTAATGVALIGSQATSLAFTNPKELPGYASKTVFQLGLMGAAYKYTNPMKIDAFVGEFKQGYNKVTNIARQQLEDISVIREANLNLKGFKNENMVLKSGKELFKSQFYNPNEVIYRARYGVDSYGNPQTFVEKAGRNIRQNINQIKKPFINLKDTLNIGKKNITISDAVNRYLGISDSTNFEIKNQYIDSGYRITDTIYGEKFVQKINVRPFEYQGKTIQNIEVVPQSKFDTSWVNIQMKPQQFYKGIAEWGLPDTAMNISKPIQVDFFGKAIMENERVNVSSDFQKMREGTLGKKFDTMANLKINDVYGQFEYSKYGIETKPGIYKWIGDKAIRMDLKTKTLRIEGERPIRYNLHEKPNRLYGLPDIAMEEISTKAQWSDFWKMTDKTTLRKATTEPYLSDYFNRLIDEGPLASDRTTKLGNLKIMRDNSLNIKNQKNLNVDYFGKDIVTTQTGKPVNTPMKFYKANEVLGLPKTDLGEMRLTKTSKGDMFALLDKTQSDLYWSDKLTESPMATFDTSYMETKVPAKYLNAINFGVINTSSYWNRWNPPNYTTNIKPISVSSNISDIVSIHNRNIGNIPIVNVGEININKFGEIDINKLEQNTNQNQILRQKPMQMQDIFQLQIPETRQRQNQMQNQIQEQIHEQIQEQMQITIPDITTTETTYKRPPFTILFGLPSSGESQREKSMEFLLYGGQYRERKKKTKGFIQSLGFDVMKQQRDLFKRFGM